MKSRLLSRGELESLTECHSLRELITILEKTAYHRTLEAALVRGSEMAGLRQALRGDLFTAIEKIGAFYTEEAGEGLRIVLRRYDVHNLRAILRGLTHNAAPAEIVAALIPAGTLKYQVLAELARAPDARAFIDSLASINSPFAWPLVRARLEHPGADTARMELALEQWYFRQAQSFLERAQLTGGVLAAALRLEADLENLSTVLRFLRSPQERRLLQDWLEAGDLAQILVGPGSLTFERLEAAAGQESAAAAVEALAGTAYGPRLRAGLERFAAGGRLSDLERELRGFRLVWMAQQILRDPLGIGVPLGYLALKENEVNNLHWIARGIQLGLDGKTIRAGLELVS